MLKKKPILSPDNEITADLSNIDEMSTMMTKDDFMDELSIGYLNEMIKKQKYIIDTFGKKYCNQVLLVLDDCIESKLLNDKRFRSFIFKSRHYNISVYFISQSYYSLSKPLRNNNTQFIIFSTGNIKELRSIYEQNNNGLSWKEFYECYNVATDRPYGFLNINYDNAKKYRIIDNFKEFLMFE